jgi:hypothetical protein
MADFGPDVPRSTARIYFSLLAIGKPRVMYKIPLPNCSGNGQMIRDKHGKRKNKIAGQANYPRKPGAGGK